MRIGEVAQIVGISTRSIRHYHRLGVLAEPERTSGGYRDYGVADLARIARIAFLNGSGVPLRDISALLESDSDAVADLAAIREGIDRQIEQLTRQRDRLDVISQRAADGLPPGLLPEPVARALDVCIADAADDPALLEVLEHERGMLDLVALQGGFPDELTSSYAVLGTDADRRRAYLELLAGFQRIEGRRPTDVEPEIDRLVQTLLGDADIRALVASDSAAPISTATAAPTLDQLLPDPAQREVLRRVLTTLGVLP